MQLTSYLRFVIVNVLGLVSEEPGRYCCGGYRVKIVTLMENTACAPGLGAEHGLSLYIQTQGCRILFDAGQTDGFARNAQQLGVDLSQVDAAVLSHGHYDHSGGLEHFLKINQTAPVYVSPYAAQPHFNAKGNYIGISFALAESSRFLHSREGQELAPNVTLHTITADVPIEPYGLTMEEKGVLMPEDFRHEQYLLVREQGKRVLFSGCSHKGILNIMNAFSPDVLVGGFHLFRETEEETLREIAHVLSQYPTAYYTGHCTGQAQYACMKQVLGERLQSISAGFTLSLFG